MAQVDLNCDMGESFGIYKMGRDEDILPWITSANVACGFHAGDPMVMDRTVALAAANGVEVGAHPGFPDLMGFGRRTMECSPEEIRNYVIYQVGAAQGFCRAYGVKLQHVKVHGSLYNLSVRDESIFRVIAEAVAALEPSLLLVTLAGKHAEWMIQVAGEIGIPIALEGFPDRAYAGDGTLISRRLPGAVIEDPEKVAQRAVQMVSQGSVTAVEGTVVPLSVDTLCIHGDNPRAVTLAESIRKALDAQGVEVLPMSRMIQRCMPRESVLESRLRK
ncbi:MAG: LamB/YcsF family protein [Deltaproteobacteria bacterium]|nr:LamB/YcsF family protein [Deltaproteobacteria bacterium]